MRPATSRLALLAVALLAPLAASCADSPVPAPLVVGATSDPGSLVLAQVYAGALRGTGASATVVSAADPLAELDSGSVTVVVGFTGAVLRVFQPAAAARSDKDVYRAMLGALPEGVTAGDYATAAEDKPAVAVTGSTARSWGADQLSALPAHCDGLIVGAAHDTGTPTAVGGCRLPAARQFADDPTLFNALRDGGVSVAWTSTAAPDIPADLVVLTDGSPAMIQAENVVPLYRRNELTEPQLLAINQVAGVLDTAALVEMRRRVATGADPRVVADAWLADHPLGR